MSGGARLASAAILVFSGGTVLAGNSPVARAGTLRVPADQPTIASALSSSASGDTVLVAPGTYAENLVLPSGVILRAEGAPASVVIDGGGTAPVVTCTSPARGTRLEGLLLQNGGGALELGIRLGGGVMVRGGEIDLAQMTIAGSHADYGGGLFAEGTIVHWQDGALRSNAASTGGGFFANGGELYLSSVEMAENRASVGAAGYALSAAPLALVSCWLHDNVALSHAGGIYLSGSGMALNECRLSGNRAGGDGAGLYLFQGSTVTAGYTTFLDNRAAGRGGAFYATCEGPAGIGCASLALFHDDVLANQGTASGAGAVAGAAKVTVEASVVAGNQGGLVCLDARASLDVRCTAAFGNAGPSAAGDCPVAFADTFAVDPHLCDLAGGDLHRCANSPLLSPPVCGEPFLGAWGPGCGSCGPTPSRPVTWGRLRASYR